MKIEITKKMELVAVTVFASLAIGGAVGYNIGFGKGVESTENPKGDGIYFYAEFYDNEGKFSTSAYADMLKYHSTLDCPNIKSGVERNTFGLYKTRTQKAVPYTFCSMCMDDYLISRCTMRIQEVLPDTVENKDE